MLQKAHATSPHGMHSLHDLITPQIPSIFYFFTMPAYNILEDITFAHTIYHTYFCERELLFATFSRKYLPICRYAENGTDFDTLYGDKEDKEG